MRYGYGVASVRFICGTQSVHRELEARLSDYLSMEDTILYSSCFDANGGLFETLLGDEDAVISDALNHASIIDGIRLCKARRLRYANNDLNELEQALKDSQSARVRLIATDGVFSMDGSIAKLGEICDLAERYGALVMVDDSHATGFMGARGRGTHELRGVIGRIDILTGTLGKALGGASGGYVAARREIVAWLRQRSRPYLFSNSIAAAGRRGDIEGARSAGRFGRSARAPACECPLLPRTNAEPGIRFASRRASHHPGHARRGAVGGQPRGAGSGTGRLRRGLLVPGRSPWKSANSHPDQCCALPRTARSGHRCVSVRGTRSRHHPLRVL